ncbi:Sm-like protein lsm7 [Coelomomyces lativittatus]|nr:Sm-like protein lsm7 [Coelomomyces lativittatus]KAJ1505419.1 Sm-like protein lsm7 [Coelomomyces lativittatus]KAJ1506453.1 Sm-like protein lsm7 [Coelomomyces lativittatus]
MSDILQQKQRSGGRGGFGGNFQREGNFRDSRDQRGGGGGYSNGSRGGGGGGRYSHRGSGSGRGGGGGHRGGFNVSSSHSSFSNDRKRESILNLTKQMDKAVMVKFQGGREVTGILKGFDLLTNLVLDDTTEVLRENKEDTIYEHTRSLGLLVARGPSVVMIAPLDGTEEIENPFVNYINEEDSNVS